VSSVSVIAQYRTNEIPEAVSAFRHMDYTDTRIWKSGLLREAIEVNGTYFPLYPGKGCTLVCLKYHQLKVFF
jgi:hypothetical protein